MMLVSRELYCLSSPSSETHAGSVHGAAVLDSGRKRWMKSVMQVELLSKAFIPGMLRSPMSPPGKLD